MYDAFRLQVRFAPSQRLPSSVVLVPEIEGALSFAEAALHALHVSNDSINDALSEVRRGDRA